MANIGSGCSDMNEVSDLSERITLLQSMIASVDDSKFFRDCVLLEVIKIVNGVKGSLNGLPGADAKDFYARIAPLINGAHDVVNSLD